MSTTFLDAMPLIEKKVGFGELGMQGRLGYEGKSVMVRRRAHSHALSAHPPSKLVFRVGGAFSSFSCGVALNDDVPAGQSHADFIVLADGREVAVESYVLAGEPPRTMTADVTGADLVELCVRTSRWEHSHAVWLDPELSTTPAAATRLFDALGRAEMTAPRDLPAVDRCIATVVSPGFEGLLDDMIGSLTANGGCQDALLVVFVLNGNDACERVISKHGALAVRCQPRAALNPMTKAVLYSVGRIVDARCYLCLDADMIVLGNLRPIFGALEACPPGKVLACREGNSHLANRLGDSLANIYGGGAADLRTLEVSRTEEEYSLVVNDGLFAGDRQALLALEGSIRAMPRASSWADGNPRVAWRNQFIFNLALARLQCGVELDPIYNVQLHAQDVEFHRRGAAVRATWRGRDVRVLHFSGGAKRKYPTVQGTFARVEPLHRTGAGDAYGEFLDALRAWVGRHGAGGLAWSFYGSADAKGAHVHDSSVLPLLATLHYLVRSNGCVHALETGTARGISAACLASAVAHRAEARVVTLDPFQHEGREELWATLPPQMAATIEARAVGSIEGMRAALAAGERYEVALLDSVHSAEHVMAEFELATALVCAGGLILIHDAVYAGGTVAQALTEIEAAGYGVVRLWTADEGVAEGDRLGLAAIENRRRGKSVITAPVRAEGPRAQPATLG